MKIIICGAGQVGWQIARHLAREQNVEITLIDRDPALVRRAAETLDVNAITGFASYPDVLRDAGAADADLLIAATHSDEVNMVTCQVAHSLFGVSRRIARIRAQAYLDPRWNALFRADHLPIDVIISPEREVAAAALERLDAPSAFDIQYFLGGRVALVGLRLDEACPLVETPLKQLTDLFTGLRALVIAIRREGRLRIAQPEDQLFVGDEIYLFVHRDDLRRTVELFGKATERRERVVIIGGGNVGLLVARELEARGHYRIRLIERDARRAEEAAESLERTVVLNGDGLELDILHEAGADRADAVLALTDDDKTNLLAGVRVKALGAAMAVSLVNDPTLASLIHPLEIDAVIDPRASTVSSILRHVRHGRIHGVYSLGDGEAEVIEAEILPGQSWAGKPVRELDLPEGVRIGAVRKSGEILMPRGDLRLDEGDVIVLFALAADVPKLDELLRASAALF